MTPTNIASPSFWHTAGTLYQATNVVVSAHNQAAGVFYGTLPLAFNDYNLTNGELRGANLRMTNFNWRGGELNAENAGSNTITIPAGGTLTIASATAKTMTDYSAVGARRLINHGTGTWSGAGITGYYGPQLVNHNLLTLTSDSGLSWSGVGADPVLLNTGTFTKSGGTGTASCNNVLSLIHI